MINYEDRFEYFCWFDNSNRFDVDLTVNNPNIEQLIKDMLPGLSISSKAKAKTYEQAVEYLYMIIANVAKAFIEEKCVAIPRSNAFLNGETAISKRKLSKRTFILILDFLKKNGFIGEHLGHWDQETHSGQVSRYWASKTLLKYFVSLVASDFCILKKIKQVILHDNLGNEINFEENIISNFFSEKICDINEFYKSNVFQYSNIAEDKIINPYYLYNINNRNRSITSSLSPLLGTNDYLYPRVSAIFSRGSFDSGGRLYSLPQRGVGWQNIPKIARKTITINGEKTVELDFSSLHIAMLYAIQGIQLNDDPYDFSSKYRPFFKKLLLTLLNAKSASDAILSLRGWCRKLYGKYLITTKELNLLELLEELNPNWQTLAEKLILRHKPIRRFFGSDCGISLQRLDGEMMLHILSVLTTEGIQALPVHDSIIVPKIAQSRATEAMKEVYHRYMGFDCEVKAG